MQYGSKVALAAILLVSGLVSCSKGPGQETNFDGTYAGSLIGVPDGTFTFEMTGSSITGTGSLDSTYSWKGRGDPPHFTFTGTRTGRDVVIGIPLPLQFNSSSYGEDPVWVDVTTTLTLTGSINDNGVIQGPFQGPNPYDENRPFNGSWAAMKSGRAAGLTKPY